MIILGSVNIRANVHFLNTDLTRKAEGRRFSGNVLDSGHQE